MSHSDLGKSPHKAMARDLPPVPTPPQISFNSLWCCHHQPFDFLGSFKHHKLMSVPSWQSRECLSSRGRPNNAIEERSPRLGSEAGPWAGPQSQGPRVPSLAPCDVPASTELTMMERGSTLHIFKRLWNKPSSFSKTVKGTVPGNELPTAFLLPWSP